MQQDRWDRIQTLFGAALELAADAREAYLARECAGDAGLLAELRALLAADARSDTLWDGLADELPATLSTAAGGAPQVGPFRMLDKVGAGGMGVVYRALDTRLEREVALKFLPTRLNRDPAARERFVAEARAASRLDHPNVCVIHDIGETPDGRPYLAMPFYRGQTLENLIAGGRLNERQAVAIAAQVAVGLAAAHARDIVHRDIKPANIMLTEDGGVKILDFGIAKIAGVDLTNAGVGVGTVAYMAPEQLRGEAVDPRADVWALGATLYEMLTGHRPFRGHHVAEVIGAVLNAATAPPPALSAGTPPALCAIVERALQADRAARFPSAEALYGALTQLGETGMLTDRPLAAPVDGAANPGWSAELLDSLIATVTPQIGPIAPVLVRRLAKTTRSLAELHERLADHLPDTASRSAFLKDLQTQASALATQSRATRQPGTPAAGISAAPQLADIEAALKPLLGPIAGTLIRRQSANCADLGQLCRMLADYVPNDQDKHRFIEMTAPLCK